jgi:pantoate--beta-alanine ligase
VSKLTEKLCGEFRPGHFAGVATVVAKLFNVVRPDVAYFGQKDAQQALVVRRMVRDLDFPVELRICPTIRSTSGLALSSRNQYLGEGDREQAACLYQALQEARNLLKKGIHDPAKILPAMRRIIESAGPCRIQYIGIVDLDTVQEVSKVDRPVLVALAVKIGQTRLIDNIVVDPEGNELIMSEFV